MIIRILLTILITALMGLGCEKNSGTGNLVQKEGVTSSFDMLAGNWVLIQSDVSSSVPSVSDSSINLEFSSFNDNNGILTVNGNAGCNSYIGEIKIDGDSFTVQRLKVTQMECPEKDLLRGQNYLTALASARSYELVESILVINCDTGILTYQSASNSKPSADPVDSSELMVHFIDVGQGDSILIDLDTVEILIDGGKQSKAPIEYLKGYIDGPLDVMIATHSDPEHIAGLIEILESFEVKEIWHNGEKPNSTIHAGFLAIAENEKAKMQIASTGKEIRAGDLTLDVLYPQNLSNQSNNNSIVLHLKFGETDFLFTGDAEYDAEYEMIQMTIPDVEILKVSHHASKTASSAEFLQRIQPEVAIYMCADICTENNPEQYPHEETISRLDSIGADVYGTDHFDTIIVATDGSSYNVIREVPKTGDFNILNPSLLGNWDFNEITGNRAYNNADYDNDGIIYGANRAEGIEGNALVFDGIDDYVGLSDCDKIKPTNAFTLAAWIKVGSNASTNYIFSDKYKGGTGKGILLRVHDSGRLIFWCGSGTDIGVLTSSTVLNTNTWYHIVASWNNSNKEMSLWINGVKDDLTKVQNGIITYEADATTSIGRWEDNGYFNGMIDQFILWKRALSPDEIGELYNQYLIE